MKVISVILFRKNEGLKNSIKLSETFEVASFGFFQRSSVKEIAVFVSRCAADVTALGERSAITHPKNDEFVAHIFVRRDGLVCVALTDKEYPQRVAQDLIRHANEKFVAAHSNWAVSSGEQKALEIPGLHDLIVKYQQPGEVDRLMKIQSDLDDTKKILIKSIDDLMIREEELNKLVDKSEDLSFQSKAFMKSSQSLNSCCVLL